MGFDDNINSVEEKKKIPLYNKSGEVMKKNMTKTKIGRVSQVRYDHTCYTSIAEARDNNRKVMVTFKPIAPKVIIDKPKRVLPWDKSSKTVTKTMTRTRTRRVTSMRYDYTPCSTLKEATENYSKIKMMLKPVAPKELIFKCIYAA